MRENVTHGCNDKLMDSPTSTNLFRKWSTAGFVGCVVVACAVSSPTRVAAQAMKQGTLERCKKATVMVWTMEKVDTRLGSGSGAFINSSGLLFTNNHVVDPVSNLPKEEHDRWHYEHNKLTWEVTTDAGTAEEKPWKAVVVYQNKSTDLALLQAYDEDDKRLQWPHYLRFLPESRLQERVKLWAFGFPGGDAQRTSRDRKAPEVTTTDGHVLHVPRSPAGRIPVIYTDVLARPGNSGGPTVNEDGLLVGVVTRLAEEEGRLSTGGMKKTGLVPCDRVRQMVLTTIKLDKIPRGTDYAPFVELLADEQGQLNIPEYERMSDKDVIYFEGGDRYFGDVKNETIDWNLALGQMKVPTTAVAYVLRNEEGSHLFLEGGNRVFTSEADLAFEFVPEGGAPTTLKFDEIQTLGFRTSKRKLHPVTREIVVLDTALTHLPLTHLRLIGVEGKVRFEGRFPIEIALKEIVRIDTNDADEQVVVLTDGRRMTGRFSEDTFRAKIADTNTPIEFSLAEVGEARVEIIPYRPDKLAGLGLIEVVASGDRDVREIAVLLEAGDVRGARPRIEEMLASDDFRQLPDVKKEQIRLLAADAALRDGDARETPKLFRKCTKSADENVGVYANACSMVLKRFDDFEFEGKPLSNRATFVAAGSTVAGEYIQQVRDILKDAAILEGERRAEYVRGVNDVKKYEGYMKAAAVFRGIEAEDELFRLWRYATDLSQREIQRIGRELGEEPGQARSGRPGRSSGQRTARRGSRDEQTLSQRQVDELNQQREEVEETLLVYQIKLAEAGYRIEDPDIQKQREREEAEESEGGPDDEP